MNLESKKSKIVPSIRKDLKWEEVPEDKDFPYRIIDENLGHKIKLDKRGKLIASLMKKPQTLNELKKKIELEDKKPISDEVIEKILDVFEKYHLLESIEHKDFLKKTKEKEKILSELKKAPLLIPEDYSFTCTRCGSCCAGHNIGPVNPQFIEKINAQEYKNLMEEVKTKRSLFFTITPQTDEEEEEIFVCSMKNGACIFLDENSLCILHKKYGEKSKPFVCRLFPFQFIRTPNGIEIGFQFECRNFLNAIKGKPLRKQEKYIKKLLPLASEIPSLRSITILKQNFPITFEEYEKIEKDILQFIENCNNSWDCILEVNERLRKSTNGSFSENLIQNADFKKFFYDFLRLFVSTTERMRDTCKIEGDKIIFHTENLDDLLRALKELRYFVSNIFLNERSQEILQLFKYYYRNFWIVKEALHSSDIYLGEALFAFKWFLVKAVTISRMNYIQRRFFTAQDILDGIVCMNNLFRNKRFKALLNKFKENIQTLFFENLSLLINQGKNIEEEPSTIDVFLY